MDEVRREKRKTGSFQRLSKKSEGSADDVPMKIPLGDESRVISFCLGVFQCNFFLYYVQSFRSIKNYSSIYHIISRFSLDLGQIYLTIGTFRKHTNSAQARPPYLLPSFEAHVTASKLSFPLPL